MHAFRIVELKKTLFGFKNNIFKKRNVARYTQNEGGR